MAQSLYGVLAGLDDALAIIVTNGGPRVTRGQLQQAVVSTALSLRAAGIKPGDVVSIAMANTVCVHVLVVVGGHVYVCVVLVYGRCACGVLMCA